MDYVLEYVEKVKSEDLVKIDKANKSRIKEAIESRLIAAPEIYGEPLRRNLKGYWKMRVGDYRVVFKITGKKILILAIAHRKKIYEMVIKRA